jgi:hypothetical protein
MTAPNIFGGTGALPGGTVTGDQMTRIDMGLHDASDRKVAASGLYEDAGQFVGGGSDILWREVLDDRQWQSQDAGFTQGRKLFSRKCAGFIEPCRALLHPRDERRHAINCRCIVWRGRDDAHEPLSAMTNAIGHHLDNLSSRLRR